MLESIVGTTNGIIAVVIVLGACIFFHELGHFTLAKLVGMRVHEFAIGFGRRLVGVRRGETEYRVNLIPLGGYVRIAGMEPGAPPEERGFYRFPRWAGGTVLFAGSFMNVVLAALAFIAISIATGVPVFPGHSVNIRKVMPGTPAAAAGLQAGDQVIAIDGMTDSLLIDRVDPGGPADQAGGDPGQTEVFEEITSGQLARGVGFGNGVQGFQGIGHGILHWGWAFRPIALGAEKRFSFCSVCEPRIRPGGEWPR